MVEKREANRLQYCERFLRSSPKIESRPFDTTDLLSCIFFFFFFLENSIRFRRNIDRVLNAAGMNANSVYSEYER